MAKLVPFEGRKIRTIWGETMETLLFSLVDAIAALTDSSNPADYPKNMRKRGVLLCSYIGTNCPQVP